MAAPACWSYRLGRSLYVHVTSATNSTTLVQSRGPGFVASFIPVAALHALKKGGQEPTAEELAQEVHQQLATEPADSVVLAGLGEPTLALREVLTLGALLRGAECKLRLNTNGLGSLQHGRDIVLELREAGIDGVSVMLNASTAAQYRRALRPAVPGATFEEAFSAACAFVARSAAVLPPGSVEVTCVATPGITVRAVEELVQTLAPADAKVAFRERPFFPLVPSPSFPVHCDSHAGDLEALAKADDSALLALDDRGNPPLVWAGEAGQTAAVRLLLERGCSIDAPGMVGNAALHRACARAHAGTLAALLELRADPDVRNNKGQTPLHVAAFYQHAACVRALLQAGADPRQRDGHGRTPAQDTADDAIRDDLLAAEAVGGSEARL